MHNVFVTIQIFGVFNEILTVNTIRMVDFINKKNVYVNSDIDHVYKFLPGLKGMCYKMSSSDAIL